MAKVFKNSNLNIWCYTGYTFEELLEAMKIDTSLRDFLNNIDVLVDGCRFMLSFINYIRHTLDIEFEDSVRYKIIQRILKDNNKSGGYSEEKKEITFTC